METKNKLKILDQHLDYNCENIICDGCDKKGWQRLYNIIEINEFRCENCFIGYFNILISNLEHDYIDGEEI